MVLSLRLRVACNSQPSALGFDCARKLVEDARNLWADAEKFKCNSHFKFMPSVRLCRNPFGNAKNFYCCLKIAGAMPWICMLKDFYSECNCAGFYNRNASKISFLQGKKILPKEGRIFAIARFSHLYESARLFIYGMR